MKFENNHEKALFLVKNCSEKRLAEFLNEFDSDELRCDIIFRVRVHHETGPKVMDLDDVTEFVVVKKEDYDDVVNEILNLLSN